MSAAEKQAGKAKAEPPAAAEDASAESSAASPDVSVAFGLGWRMARLYRSASGRVEIATDSSRTLPGMRDLPSGLRTEIHLGQIEAALHRLSASLALAGVEAPSMARLRASFSSDEPAKLRAEVHRLHIAVLGRLMAGDFRLGKAYGLGRALADTSRIDSWQDLSKRWGFRRTTGLQEWLTDLSSAFPAHSARAVSLSIERWRKFAGALEPGDWQAFGAEVSDRLDLQGHLWRALLSGEKRGTDMLRGKDYVRAADGLLDNLRSTVRAFRARFPALVAVIGLLLLAAVALLLTAGGEGSSKEGSIVAGLAAAATALGIGWKGVGSVLSVLAGKLREPLWGVALDYTIAEAIDRRPNGEAEELEEVVPSGPQQTYRRR